MNAQGGEILNEEELNRDWLDWVYTFSRAAILLSIVYFYSSFSRFIMVMMAMLVLYLWVTCLLSFFTKICVRFLYLLFFLVVPVYRHQAGWFPFNLENDLQLPGDRPNQEDEDGEQQNQDVQEMVNASLI